MTSPDGAQVDGQAGGQDLRDGTAAQFPGQAMALEFRDVLCGRPAVADDPDLPDLSGRADGCSLNV